MSENPGISKFLVLLPLVAMLLTPGVAKAQCPASPTKNTKLPKPAISAGDDSASIIGSVPRGTKASLVLCVNGAKQSDSVAVNADGTFRVGSLAAGSTVAVQLFVNAGGGGASPEYGPASSSVTLGDSGLSKAIFIGGVEQSTYSSLSQNTTAFLNAFIEGPDGRVTGWGKVRLLGAPQPSTQGIVSTFTDPTGQLTTQDYTKVGQSLDFVVGPRIGIAKHWSIIAEGGVTTPLSSQTVALTYTAPPAGTIECSTVVTRFSVKNGYSPGLTAAPSGSSSCLTNNGTAVTAIAFSNQDRSNFLVKYGAGFRTSNRFECQDSSDNTSCTSSYGVLDLTVGQDEAVTRGLLRHFVFKMDGVLPLGVGDSKYIYLFGSAYIRLAKNQDLSPLILQQATSVTVPSAGVVVLPLQQPDRDFYRIGVGLNINQIFCKMFSTTCPQSNKSPAGGATPQKTL